MASIGGDYRSGLTHPIARDHEVFESFVRSFTPGFSMVVSETYGCRHQDSNRGKFLGVPSDESVESYEEFFDTFPVGIFPCHVT
jgi:hypothetical protein